MTAGPDEPCPLCETRAPEILRDPAMQRAYCGCETCGLRFVREAGRPSRATERAHYDLHENDVDDVRYQAFVAPLRDVIKERIPAGARGLDFGAGPGPALAKLLRDEGYDVTLYDPNYWPDPAALTKFYDFIVTSEVVEHLFAPRRELQRLRDCLRPGGVLAIMTALVTPAVDFGSWYYRRDPTHVVFYEERTFRWIRDSLGFATVETDGQRVVVLTR